MDTNKPEITVIGSANMDMVVKSKRIPQIGETLLGGEFLMASGGKGANQAVAAARLGSNVNFICSLGDDVFGSKLLKNYIDEAILTDHIKISDSTPTGIAMIMVDNDANNIITVAPGANSELTIEDIDKAKAQIAASKVVVAQLEIPLSTVVYASKVAKEYNIPFILDPAPAQKLPDELLPNITILKPNETEAGILTGINVKDQASAKAAAEKLLSKGIKSVIITMSDKGFLLADSGKIEFIKGLSVSAVDTTAAGDAFTGALATAVSQGKSLKDAAIFANKVASVSVTKMGAQSSLPTLQEVNTVKI